MLGAFSCDLPQQPSLFRGVRSSHHWTQSLRNANVDVLTARGLVTMDCQQVSAQPELLQGIGVKRRSS
jgi:hypothetical protein